MLRKEQSSLGARRAVETNCGRRAASMVQGLDRRLDLRRDFDKPRPSASARHQPPITPLSRPTLLTGQGLAQAEKPKPACSLAPHSSRASTGEERRIDLHPVLLRAGVLPRPDKLRASRERPAKLHEAPSSRQLRHVEPPGLASSTCSGTRLENEGERGDDHASGKVSAQPAYKNPRLVLWSASKNGLGWLGLTLARASKNIQASFSWRKNRGL